jgi:hypothetical protein
MPAQVSACLTLTERSETYGHLPQPLSWIHLTSSGRVCSVGDVWDAAQATSMDVTPPAQQRRSGRPSGGHISCDRCRAAKKKCTSSCPHRTSLQPPSSSVTPPPLPAAASDAALLSEEPSKRAAQSSSAAHPLPPSATSDAAPPSLASVQQTRRASDRSPVARDLHAEAPEWRSRQRSDPPRRRQKRTLRFTKRQTVGDEGEGEAAGEEGESEAEGEEGEDEEDEGEEGEEEEESEEEEGEEEEGEEEEGENRVRTRTSHQGAFGRPLGARPRV